MVRNAVGVDYSEYKPATLERRLDRRMALRNIGSREGYLKLLLEEPERGAALVRGRAHPRHLLLSRPGGLRADQAGASSRRSSRNKADGRADSTVGRRLLDGRRGLLARHRAARVSRRRGALASDPDLRHRHQRDGDRRRPRRRLLRQRVARRQRRAAAALLHQGRSRLPHQQVRARAVRLRAARPGARSAVLEARPGELPQRPHLLRRRRCRSASSPRSTTASTIPAFSCSAAPRASPASASSSPGPIAAARPSRAPRGAARSASSRAAAALTVADKTACRARRRRRRRAPTVGSRQVRRSAAAEQVRARRRAGQREARHPPVPRPHRRVPRAAPPARRSSTCSRWRARDCSRRCGSRSPQAKKTKTRRSAQGRPRRRRRAQPAVRHHRRAADGRAERPRVALPRALRETASRPKPERTPRSAKRKGKRRVARALAELENELASTRGVSRVARRGARAHQRRSGRDATKSSSRATKSCRA